MPLTFKIIALTQVYNELRTGNLPRFLEQVGPLVDTFLFYDDCSTDGSYEYLLSRGHYVTRGTTNSFNVEHSHFQILIEQALKLQPDFLLRIDCDEIFCHNSKEALQKVCRTCVDENIDAAHLRSINLWRSPNHKRVDDAYDSAWFSRLWRVKPDTRITPHPGLHRMIQPDNVKSFHRFDTPQILHYGFADDQQLAGKFLTYRRRGQSGWGLTRMLDESTLEVKRVEDDLIPTSLRPSTSTPPVKRTLHEAVHNAYQYRPMAFKPGVSIFSLIYKSTHWLDFCHKQILKYTQLDNIEYFFLANNANASVLDALSNNYIPHHVFIDPCEAGEWHINNVYRAYNEAARLAKGDYLLFINSDMAFTPGWVENLLGAVRHDNCVAARLVESGKLRSGQYGIEKNFGRSIETYDEAAFQSYAKSIQKQQVVDGGLYMPLLIRKDYFFKVGGYPHGNVVPGSDLHQPKIARKGEPLIPGDKIFMQKLQKVGIRHQTNLDSVVYHFQEGELDDAASESESAKAPLIAICNDTIQGTMGERVMWGVLTDELPRAIGLDARTSPGRGSFSRHIANDLEKNHPSVRVIVQNATFMDVINPDLYTIVYLQDDLRRMGRPSKQQERNLAQANLVVTNSRITAAFYPEYDCEIIPIGTDHHLFTPHDREQMRVKHDIPQGRVGIFVGALDEIKGWSRISHIIRNRQDVFWIVVSKDQNPFESPNARVYRRLPQAVLAELMSASDFFMIGSPVETQCLAALEAGFCGLPVIMPDTGIFADLPQAAKSRLGIFGEDLEKSIDQVLGLKWDTRKQLIDLHLTVEGMVQQWHALLCNVHSKIQSAQMQSVSLSSLKLQRFYINKPGLKDRMLSRASMIYRNIRGRFKSR